MAKELKNTNPIVDTVYSIIMDGKKNSHKPDKKYLYNFEMSPKEAMEVIILLQKFNLSVDLIEYNDLHTKVFVYRLIGRVNPLSTSNLELEKSDLLYLHKLSANYLFSPKLNDDFEKVVYYLKFDHK